MFEKQYLKNIDIKLIVSSKQNFKVIRYNQFSQLSPLFFFLMYYLLKCQDDQEVQGSKTPELVEEEEEETKISLQ